MGEDIDEGKILAFDMSLVLRKRISLHIFLGSKNMFTILSAKRNSKDRWIRTDVNCIQFDFERRHVARIIWIPYKLNFADSGTKR